MRKRDIRIVLDGAIAQSEALTAMLRATRAEMANRPPQTRGENVSRPVTPELIEQIRVYHNQFPKVPQHQLGTMFGVQQGRISEILAGKRK